jgi:hypothetical protein
MTPVRLRVSLSKGAPPLHVGDRILVLANLSPTSRHPLARRRPAPSISSASPGASSSTLASAIGCEPEANVSRAYSKGIAGSDGKGTLRNLLAIAAVSDLRLRNV